ncbi:MULTISPECIES: hypothetical protein [Enterobacter cloacae complex]|uniref:hypothetical protein n=1 Tax=Enterobacter cloacae complex TaxID=354276 RepID=UPI00079184B8|nr:hypothetical protein [Enterobacter cloacae]SAH78692.1 Uncharacterised protein [Enterobacter cloacae]
MTNVSVVEKMAELMQQMEENSPRVAAFQYCLKQVAEKVEEAEKRNAELQARCEALAAENALLKKSEPAPFSKLMMEALDVYQTGADEVPELAMLSAYKKLRDGLKTPATDAFLAEVRASGIDQWIASRNGRWNGTTAEAERFAAQLRKGVQS